MGLEVGAGVVEVGGTSVGELLITGGVREGGGGLTFISGAAGVIGDGCDFWKQIKKKKQIIHAKK